MPEGSYGLSNAMAGFIEAYSTRKSQKLKEFLAEFERQMAQKKFAEDEAYRKRYLDILEGKNEPEAAKFQQYETPEEYGAFNPMTGEYIKRGGLTPKPPELKSFAPGSVYGTEQQGKFVPQGTVPYRPETEKPKSPVDYMGTALKFIPGMELTEEQKAANRQALDMGKPEPYPQKTPSLAEVYPKAESLSTMGQTGMWAPPTPKEQEIITAIAALPHKGKGTDWARLAADNPDVDVNKIQKLLGLK